MEPISIIIIIAGVGTFVGGMFVTFYNCYLEQKEKNSIKIPVTDLGAMILS